MRKTALSLMLSQKAFIVAWYVSTP